MLGYIYKINYENLSYYGSSRAKYRITKHKNEYDIYKRGGRKATSSCDIFKLADEKGAVPSNEILETFDNITDEDLLIRENYYINNFDCVNKQNAITTKEEKLEQGRKQNKKWRDNNKELVKEIKKEYAENHKEQLAEYHKEYRKKNKEQLAGKKKEYAEKNKEHIQSYKKEWNEKKKNEMTEEEKQKKKEESKLKMRERRAKKKVEKEE
jgi:hypothetical protein